VNAKRSGGMALLAVLAAGCDAPPPREVPFPPASWSRIVDGWARTVALEPPLVLDAVPPGQALEALVLPSGPGELVIEAGGAVERTTVTTAARVLVALPGSGRTTLRFDGAPALLHAPRLVPGVSALRRDDPARRSPRRVLLVVIDTLRADAVTPETMPELVAAFAGGARFTHAYSTATWTLPAVASIFTGRSPTALALPDGALVALAPDEPTIASDLAAAGFHTVGISANYTVHHENGYSAGFELFLVPAVLEHGDWPDAPWVLDRARQALRWFPDRDLFLYLHLMDTHDPYRDQETGESLQAPSTGASADAAARVERLRRAYRSEAHRVSVLLADFLRDAGPFERAVVTADHGEEFLEHGGWKHGPTVYPEVSRVPLLVRGMGVEEAEVEAPVSLLGLRRFLAGGDLATLERDHDVDVVSFVHAAPRFSVAHGDGQTILFGHDLGRGAGAAGGSSAGAEDPIGAWLRAHHPAIDFVDAGGAPRRPRDGEAGAAALRLAARFRGLRGGRWILAGPDAGRFRVETGAVGDGGWWWGAAKSVELTSPAVVAGAGGEAGAVLTIEGPDPFALVFLPEAGGSAPSLRSQEGGLERAAGPPSSILPGRAVTWSDAGRPPKALAGVEETLRRLRAQGYL
jgi:hypothetical protein